jgi:hypothetical protein
MSPPPDQRPLSLKRAAAQTAPRRASRAVLAEAKIFHHLNQWLAKCARGAATALMHSAQFGLVSE